MRKYWLLLIILFAGLSHHSQKIQILHQSGFTHNYVISDLQFIEDPLDTSRLKYIATLSFSGEQDHLLTVGTWFDVIKIRAKSLGANSYLVEEYSENESSVKLILKFYFAGTNFLKTNENKGQKNSVVVFNQTRYKPDTASFYLNNNKIEFDPAKSYSFKTEVQKPYYLSTNNSSVTSKKIHHKKSKPSLFFIIPASKYSFVVNRNKLNPNLPGMAIYGIIINFGRNAAYALNYQLGRLLLEVYK